MKLEGLNDDAVVISGISGKFPNSDNINELMANLMNGEDCVMNNPRWQFEHSKVPSRCGRISQINKFDNVNFGINEKHSNYIDPVVKMTMEATFEAVADAGINPVELRKMKTSVYGSFSLAESDKSFLDDKLHRSTHYLLGCSRNFLPNRISYYFNLIGPSCTIDSFCTSTAVAFQKAFENIKSGDCDGVIVCGGILSLLPDISYQMFELGLLSIDGINRSFDDKANGFSRSEAIGSIFLQRAKYAKRIYAEVVNICVMYGEAIPQNSCLLPTAKFQAQIMKQTLKHSGLKSSDINYIEADGTPIKLINREELKAIDLVYGQDRSSSNPLLIGSIQSNIGYTFGNNTINSIIKVLIAMETGVISPNLHYDMPPEDAKCLQDGRVKVVTKLTPWTDRYAAVNTIALTGIFSHIILKRHSKEKQKRKLSQNNMPRLYVASGRSKEMISSFFNVLKQNRGNDELGQFFNDLTEKPFSHSLYSGYTVISEFEEADSNQTIEMIQEIASVQSQQIYFVFSGMGSQWIGMGESLMKIPIFAEAIKKCDVILKPRGYDIVKIICDKDPTIYDNIINCFLGIAAIQIGLVDILYAVDVKPDYIIGHSVGELGCAYADGCFTAEQMILSSLCRGLASVESDLIHGTMAAIGLGYEQIRHLCPEDIDVACHNGPESSTISGPTESINAFVKELQSKGIFAKIVPTSNIAFHSRYILPAGPKLLDYLNKIIPQPKNRSKRWISTSIPKNKWHIKKARFSSPEYHTNNLLSSVLFEEVLQMLPRNAITIEISPHSLLQTILRKSLDRNCINLSLTKRGNKDNATLILHTLGQLYNLGYPIKPRKLYPRVPYPVSRGTPSISSLIHWDHRVDWMVTNYEISKMKPASESSFLLDLESDEYKLLRNFKINNNVFIPLAIYLKLVVNIYSNLISKMADDSFILENIIIYNQLLEISSNGKIHLNIIVFTGSRTFEVRNKDNIIIISGTIRLAKSKMNEMPEVVLFKKEMEILYKEDIYRNLLSRGYQYDESYNLINRLSASCSNGILNWSNDWRLLLEGLIQVHIISSKNKNILMPSRIQKIVIDTEKLTNEMMENNAIPIKFEKHINVIACPGIAMIGIRFKEIVVENRDWEIVADELRFIQNMDEKDMNVDDVCNVVIGLISKNISKNSTDNIIVTKESEKYGNENIIECLENTLKKRKENFNIKLIAKELLKQTMDENFILMIINNAHFNDVKKFINISGSESFLLTFIETKDEDNVIATLTSVGLNVVLKIKITLRRTALLLQKEKKLRRTVIKSQEDYIDRLKICLRDSKYDNVIFLVNTITENNILEILRDIKREPGYEKLQIFDLQDAKAPKFSLQNEFYEYQINLNLRENVLSPNGVWGTYRWMPLSLKSTSSSRWQAKINKSGSLEWMEELPLIKEKNKNIIKVEYAAFDLNVYEYCLKNNVSLESQISITEYSGIDEKGRRVMGLVENFTINNEISPDPDFTWIIPDTLSFAEAATIPQAYLAAFCILHSDCKFKENKTILIHFGASDVGQALINLSLSYHLDVYTTYETEAEKGVIESMRPRLPQSHIINIQNYNINIMNITKGEGLDLVIASYSILDDIETSLDVTKELQYLVIVHDLKDCKYNSVRLGNLLRNISIYSHCLQDLIKLPPTKKRELAELMGTALQAGTLKPIISRRLQLQGTIELFQEKKTAACERYGKVLVNLQEQKKLSEFIPQFFFHSDKCYFVIEGFNTFGRELIEWMIEQGVRKLFVTSNKSIQDHKNLVLKWRESGTTIIVRDEVDMNEVTRFENLLKEAVSMGQLDGIFDLQRTKMDSSIPSLKYSKVTQALDKYSRKLCPLHVQFFVFSSLDLDEDDLGDLTVEKICKERKESGHHGLFILLPNFVEKICTETQFDNIYYTKMSLFLQRLSALLSTDASLIAVRHIIKDNSDEKKNIVAIETDEKQRSIEVDPREKEIQDFEEYIYSNIKHLKFYCE